MFLASVSAVFLGFITIFLGKTRSLGSLATSQPSEESITGLSVNFLASLWPIPLGLGLGSVHSRLLLEYCPG